MRSNPKHVLVGELESRDKLVKAQKSSRPCQWRVPKDSKRGDVVLILIGGVFVGEAVIRKDAQATDTPRIYSSTLGDIHMWEEGAPIEAIIEQVPAWKYLTYSRTYASVPSDHQNLLRQAINRSLEGGESFEEERPPTLAKDSEILSVPAGNSIAFIEATGVYACPDRPPFSAFQEIPFMTFRHPGGAMKHIYTVVWKGVLPRLAADSYLVPEEHRARVKDYIGQRQKRWHFTGGPFMFYVFAEERAALKPGTGMVPNLRVRHYYHANELLSSEEIEQLGAKGARGKRASTGSPLPSTAQVMAKVEAEEGLHAFEPPEPAEPIDVDSFAPETLTEAREYLARQVIARRGQARFRQSLLAAYGEQCAFTDYFGTEALEAAHIVSYRGGATDHVTNGLLLRADIHSLFDQGLIVVDTSEPENLHLVLAPDLVASSYKFLQGKKIRVPQDRSLRPSLKSLEWHRKRAGI